jgi:hypothetical protein
MTSQLPTTRNYHESTKIGKHPSEIALTRFHGTGEKGQRGSVFVIRGCPRKCRGERQNSISGRGSRVSEEKGFPSFGCYIMSITIYVKLKLKQMVPDIGSWISAVGGHRSVVFTDNGERTTVNV